MADAIIQVGADGVGKKLQTKENVIGANSVHSEAVFLTNDDGTSVNPSKEATQVLAEAHLGTIDTSTATIAGDTTSIDGKITACDTTALATQATLATIDADTGTIAGDTTSIDGKITACNTGAVTVAASALPAGASTEATLSAAEVHEGNIETDLALVHAHIAAIETDLALVHTHVSDAETHLGTIDTAIGEINTHVHVLQGTDCKQAYVNIQADGDILALVAGKKIRVHAIVIHAIDTSSGTIETGAGAGAIKLKWSLAAREGMVLPFNPAGWFETVAGEALYGDFVVGAETVFVITYSEV